MKLRCFILLLIVNFILTANLYSQNYELREVSKEELQQSASEIDSTAGAEILYFDKKYTMKYLCRL